MKQHEREYFTSRIRSGVYRLKFDDVYLKIRPLSLEQDLELQEKCLRYYRKAQDDGFLTNEELLEKLKERDLWSDEEDDKIKGLEKDIDRLKVELYQNKNKEKLIRRIRAYIAAGKQQLSDMLDKKHKYIENSCEGIMQVQKLKEMMAISCYRYDKDVEVLYDFEEVPVEYIVKLFGMQILSEASIRNVARGEPWRSTWLMNESNAYNLFSNTKDCQLTTDQRNLLIWSRMYDNVQESMDCPGEDVIEDDDMLDGWFILQKKEREKDKAEREISKTTNNPKISQSDEIFVFADNQETANKINETNTFHSQTIKKQRMAVVKSKGEAEDLDFQDQRLKVQSQQNEMYKNKFRR